jgi:hypothetical protein
MSFHPPVPFALREEGRSDEFLKELHDKLSAKHLKSVIKMRGMLLFKKIRLKDSICVLWAAELLPG